MVAYRGPSGAEIEVDYTIPIGGAPQTPDEMVDRLHAHFDRESELNPTVDWDSARMVTTGAGDGMEVNTQVLRGSGHVTLVVVNGDDYYVEVQTEGSARADRDYQQVLDQLSTVR
jgi:hypothetical protein